MWGLKRGLYSNEAGMGSAPNAAARADVAHPVKQGLVQSLSVYLDTLLICTATAFMVLSTTSVDLASFADKEPADYVQACMHAALGGFGPVFLSCAMSLFAFTTLIGNYSYVEGCLAFILKREATKTELTVTRIIATILVFLGAVASSDLVWNTADMAQGLMVVTNIPSIAILGGVAIKCLNDYTKQKKEGKAPVFKAENIGIEDKVECWK
jgi:AGCS family alanine or glycine:cation symporter